MTQLCDLHTHSNVSDGTFTPGELVEEAARQGVTHLALTDHDAVEGIAEAREHAERIGLDLIPGIEISVTEAGGDRQMHILGLGIDPDSEDLTLGVESFRQARMERGRQMVKQLNACGVGLEFSAVERIAGSGTLGRPHVARALVEGGYCQNNEEAFARYLRRGRPAYVLREEFSAREAIALIHSAGGIAALAHPPLSIGVSQPGGLDAFVACLVPHGLDALEVQHPGLKPAMRRRLRKLGRQHDLVPVGGSDFHGSNRPGVELGRGRGDVAVGSEIYERVSTRIAQRRAELTDPQPMSTLPRPR